jgi:hypothetical protein
LLSIATVDSLIVWWAFGNLKMAWTATMLVTLAGVAFLILGFVRSSIGNAVAGTGLVTLGLSGLLEAYHFSHLLRDSYDYIEPTSSLPIALDAILALAALSLILIATRQYPPSRATATACLLCGAAVLALAGIGPTLWRASSNHALVSVVTGVVLLVAGAVSWWLTRRSADLHDE